MNASKSHAASISINVESLLRELRLRGIRDFYASAIDTAERESLGFLEFLQSLLEMESSERKRRRIERHLQRSGLPEGKTLSALDVKRFPVKVRRVLPVLCSGDFVSRGDNVLAFGLPGRGKTHLCAAVGHELIKLGFQVLFTPAFRLVQRLLLAKKELRLDEELRRLDRFDVIILDDIGYVQHSRDEMSVLFTFLSERYERKSVMLTSNLVFSEWEKIFQDPMTTAAAIDRLVHHCTIIEMSGQSLRAEAAKKRREDSG